MKRLILSLFSIQLVASAIASPNLLVNGGFEQPSIKALPGPWQNGWNTNWVCFGPTYSLDYPGLSFPGWQLAGEVDVIKDGSVLLSSLAPVKSAQGEQMLDLDGRMPGTIAQVVSVSAGKKYRFKFDYACYSPASMTATVQSSNGGTLFTTNISATPDGTNTPAWTPVETEITAIDNSLTVTFNSTSRDLWMSGLLLDNVQLLLNADTDGDGLTDDWERGVGRYQVVEGNFAWDEAKADAESRGGGISQQLPAKLNGTRSFPKSDLIPTPPGSGLAEPTKCKMLFGSGLPAKLGRSRVGRPVSLTIFRGPRTTCNFTAPTWHGLGMTFVIHNGV